MRVRLGIVMVFRITIIINGYPILNVNDECYIKKLSLPDQQE